MLITQTNLSEDLSELPAVLDETCCRLLIDFRVGGLHGHIVGSLKCVGIRAVVVAVLAANGEVTLQHGIAEDEFRGPEVVGVVGIILDGAVNGGSTDKRSLLSRAAWRIGIVEESVDIQVDTQLSHLTVVIGVEDVLLDALVLPDVARGALSQDVVLKHICQIVTLRLATWRTVVFVVGAEGMVLIDHIIELQLRRPCVPRVSDLLSGVTRYLVRPHVVKHIVDL